jgi:hypothetical protein
MWFYTISIDVAIVNRMLQLRSDIESTIVTVRIATFTNNLLFCNIFNKPVRLGIGQSD